MAGRKNYKEIELTSGGGAISLDLSRPYDTYYVYTSGSVTLTSSWSITYSGTSEKGMEIEARWRANIDLNGNSVTIFGWSVPSELTDKNFTVILYYNGSSWETDVQMDYEEDNTITGSHLASDTVQGGSIDFSQLLGDGITEDPADVISAHMDSTNGTSLEKSSDGLRLSGDESSPTDQKFYGKLSGAKGWDFLGSGMERYDSGWKRIPDYTSTGSHGLVRLTNWNQPYFRIIGRTVFLTGRMLIPLTDPSDTTTFITDADNYKNTMYARVKNGSDTGISLITDGSNNQETGIEFPSLFGDNDLGPDHRAWFNQFNMSRRIVSNTILISMNAVCTNLRVETDGSLQMNAVVGHETSSGIVSSVLKNSQLRYLNTRAKSSDYVLDWSNYRTAHDGSSFLNNQDQSSEQFGFDINANQAGDWGGFIVPMEGIFWHLSDSLSLEDIRAKFSNYADA